MRSKTSGANGGVVRAERPEIDCGAPFGAPQFRTRWYAGFGFPYAQVIRTLRLTFQAFRLPWVG